MKITAKDILSLEHCEHSGFEHVRGVFAKGVSTDSRTITKGNVFVALRGEHFDGHDFLSVALAGGAAAVIVEKEWAEKNRSMLVSLGVPALVVQNTTHTLGELARNHRRKFSIPVIMVAGSNGKTTTKELIASVLKERYDVLYTEKNFNNHIGVPLTLFQLKRCHDIVVLEAGTNHPGELSYLCSIAEPTHGLLTNIGREHLEHFQTLEGVARAEGELFEYLRQRKGTLFVNADDPWVVELSRGYKKVVPYGFQFKRAVVRGKKLEVQQNGCARFVVYTKRLNEFPVELSIPGVHNAMNALAAVTVGVVFRVPKTAIQRSLTIAQPPSKRMEVRTIGGVTILDDTYNANPDSVRAALHTLSLIQCTGKRIAVLGDMFELGEKSPEYHREVGKFVDEYSVDVLITHGTFSEATYTAASRAEKHHCQTKEEIKNVLINLLTAGDCVLIKGSRGMKMEEVVHHLINHFSQTTEGR